MEMPDFFQLLDPYLIRLYRITGWALADFLLGTLILALLAVILGEISVSLAYLALRKRIDQVTTQAAKYQDLSVKALMAGNKPAYKAANQLANDAFGKSFFSQIALSAGFLWPVFVALAWMQYRFADLEFPLPYSDHSLGFIGVFILLYVPAYLLFRKVKYRLPYFRRIKEIRDAYDRQRRGLKTFADLLAPPAKPASEEGGRNEGQVS